MDRFVKNVAVILAGGSGTRLGGEHPKQFLKVAGEKIIEHTIEAFEQNECELFGLGFRTEFDIEHGCGIKIK